MDQICILTVCTEHHISHFHAGKVVYILVKSEFLSTERRREARRRLVILLAK